jgi:cysteine desulfurase
MKPIYLDYNASTPLAKEVMEVMEYQMKEFYGNPSSSHWFGKQMRAVVDKARSQAASLLNCNTDEVIFTSGGTESNNFAIRGAALANQSKGNHIITTSIEHPAVLNVCKHLEKSGFEITILPVDKFGMINIDELRTKIKKSTILITIMHANNEVGTIQPISEISKIARENNIFFHTDAAQSAGKIPVDVEKLGVDLLSLAGHKLYAPQGVGILYIKRGVILEKLMYGADHERGLRPGTENVLEIAGLGKACEIAERDLEQNFRSFTQLREQLFTNLKKELPEIKLNGHPEKRLPNTLNISFPDRKANYLLAQLKSIAASTGAACHSDSISISHVLKAMNIPERLAMGSIRFSIGRETTVSEIELVTEKIVQLIRK